jgi:Tol biopolymer transport system component
MPSPRASSGPRIRGAVRAERAPAPAGPHRVVAQDGRWIAFGRDPAPGDNGIWLMRPDGSDLRRLTRNPYAGAECGCDGDPAFSPDGKRISFVRVRAERRGRGALFVMNRDGSNVRRLTPWTFDPGVNHTWEPDISLILVSSTPSPENPRTSTCCGLTEPGCAR